MTDQVLDETSFPFTRLELLHAYRQLLPRAEAEDLTARLAAVIMNSSEDSPDAALAGDVVGSSSTLILPPEIFMLLAELSPELDVRVERHRQVELANWRRLRAHRFRSSRDPLPENEMRAAIDKEQAAIEADWQRQRLELRSRVWQRRSRESEDPQRGS
ncbi:MAG: hypothetical protein ACYC0B_06770 [Gemmatimonadaceae bacterium]